MAYVCDVDQIVSAKPLAPRRAPLVARLAHRVRAWIGAWNEDVDEAAVARRLYGNCAGKLTDGMEREMMRRLTRGDWTRI